MQKSKLNLLLFAISIILIATYAITIAKTWGQPDEVRPEFLSGWKYAEGDYLVSWASCQLAWEGKAAAAYDKPTVVEIERQVMGDHIQMGCLYPPTFFFMLMPFGLLPFYPSLLAWTGLTLLLYVYVVKKIAPHPLTVWLTLAYPGVFQNFIRGQTGFLLASCIGGGLLLLPRQPLVAGVLFGVTAFKPQFLPLILVALLAGRQWRALMATAVSVAVLAGLALVAFGPGAWMGAVKMMHWRANAMQAGVEVVRWWSSPSIWAAALLVGAKPLWANLLHYGAMAIVALLVARVWFREGSYAIKAAFLTTGVLLFSPHILVYDLVMLGPALAWLAWESCTIGWLPGEKATLIACWFLPLILQPLALYSKIQIGPLALIALIVILYRRAGYFQHHFIKNKIISSNSSD